MARKSVNSRTFCKYLFSLFSFDWLMPEVRVIITTLTFCRHRSILWTLINHPHYYQRYKELAQDVFQSLGSPLLPLVCCCRDRPDLLIIIGRRLRHCLFAKHHSASFCSFEFYGFLGWCRWSSSASRTSCASSTCWGSGCSACCVGGGIKSRSSRLLLKRRPGSLWCKACAASSLIELACAEWWGFGPWHQRKCISACLLPSLTL